MKNNIARYIIGVILTTFIVSCSDDDTFSVSYENCLTFETDTLTLDTCFSTIPTPHKKLMIYNKSNDGIRISDIRLENLNQTGYRVNVNGISLNDLNGFCVKDVEISKGDSLRIFVELTSKINNASEPVEVSDNLIFRLESGRIQKVNLNAWSWDATILDNYIIGGEGTTVLQNENGKPIVIYGNLFVDSLATLEVLPGTTLYFHSNAGIDVKGTLRLAGEKDNEITLRCDRFDWMVSNLSYDNNPGQWNGIRFYSKSYNNEISYADIHGGTNAIVCDSAFSADTPKLHIKNTTIHNMRGDGISAVNGNITIENTQISNTLGDCVSVLGGNIDINNCTIVQYYPFSMFRKNAMTFANGNNGISYPLTMNVRNTIIKGYADDVVMWSHGGTENSLAVTFSHCVVRTTPGEDYEYMFKDCYIEDNPEDTLTSGRNSFVLFDTNNFFYDFTPKDNTTAIGNADVTTSLPIDRKGNPRKTDKPDIGCYEVIKEEQ